MAGRFNSNYYVTEHRPARNPPNNCGRLIFLIQLLPGQAEEVVGTSSRPGRGSRRYFIFPLSESHNQMIISHIISGPTTAEKGGQKRRTPLGVQT